MSRPSSKIRRVRTGDPPSQVAPISRVGEPIIHTGIYRVLHAGHRVSHFVILMAGQDFPRCARCGEQVEFQLVEATTDLQHDRDFSVHLYEIPHPAGDEAEDEVA